MVTFEEPCINIVLDNIHRLLNLCHVPSLVARFKRAHHVRDHRPDFRDAIVEHRKNDDEQERDLFRRG